MFDRIYNAATGEYTDVTLTPQEIADRESAANVPPAPPMPTIVASGVFKIENGWLEAVGAAAGIGMAFPIDVGTYWLFFTDAQPDLSFATYVSVSQGTINVASRSVDYVELCVTDSSGALVDPSEFSINIVRTQ